MWFFAGLVDEFASDCVAVGSLAFDSLHGLVVQHLEIAADPHATVSGNMALEVAVGDEDAAHPCGGGVVRGLHVVRDALFAANRAAPRAMVRALIIVVIADLNLARGLTTADNHLARVREIPHDLLGTLRVIVVFSFCSV